MAIHYSNRCPFRRAQQKIYLGLVETCTSGAVVQIIRIALDYWEYL